MITDSVAIAYELEAKRTGRGTSEIQRAVLLAVLYADIFDYALAFDELCDRLVGLRATPGQVRSSLRGLRVIVQDGFVVLPGREHLVELRRERSRSASELWVTARRYARWVSRVPFIRMVAISGSLAVDNASRSGDVDVFCITEENRLWVARIFLVALSRLTRLAFFPSYLCPNYLLARDALLLGDRNLFTAHEIVQARPLYGYRQYNEFRDRNAWVRDLLPNISPAAYSGEDASGAPLIEWLLGGRLGDALNEASYGAFRWFCRRRARKRGKDWRRLESAYCRDRYVVPEGGYISVVGSRFLSRVRELPDIASAEVSRLFPEHLHDRTSDWENLFEREYGHV